MSRFGTATDTLRWGDCQNVTLVNSALAHVVTMQSKQLAQARWRWPLLWGMRVSIEPQIAAGETLTFTVTFQVTIGSGQNTATVSFVYLLTAANGYAPITDFQQLPAQDIQVTCTVSSPGGSGLTDNIRVGAFLAPVTEPHAMTHVYEMMSGEADAPGARWMTEHHGSDPDGPQPGTGQGFPINPDPLHYQRRGP